MTTPSEEKFKILSKEEYDLASPIQKMAMDLFQEAESMSLGERWERANGFLKGIAYAKEHIVPEAERRWQIRPCYISPLREVSWLFVVCALMQFVS